MAASGRIADNLLVLFRVRYGSSADLDITCAQTQKAPGRLAKGLWTTHQSNFPVLLWSELLLVTVAA